MLNSARFMYDPYLIRSYWEPRISEEVPDCKVIHVEKRYPDGSLKVEWFTTPEKVDFSSEATNPVVTYLVRK